MRGLYLFGLERATHLRQIPTPSFGAPARMSAGASRRVDSMLKATAVAVFAAGVTCLAAGAWLPIKAWAAQLLIDAAWRREHTL